MKKGALEQQLKLLVDAGKGETEAAKKLQTQIIQGETDRIKKQKSMEQDFVEFKKKMNTSYKDLLMNALSMVVDNLDKQSAAYVFFKGVQKTAQLAEIGMNVLAETSSNAKWAAADPRNAIPGGSVIVGAELALKNGLSIGRAALADIKLAAFEKGGPTSQRVGEVLLSDVAKLISGVSGGSFAGGGAIDSPTIGLIGEAGPELVIPNWLYADPKQANLMGFLEASIASKGNAFATGGSTTGASAVVATDPAAAPADQLVELVQQLVRSHQEFREEISDWQRNLDVNLDPRKAKKAIDVTTQIQSGGGLR